MPTRNPPRNTQPVKKVSEGRGVCGAAGSPLRVERKLSSAPADTGAPRFVSGFQGNGHRVSADKGQQARREERTAYSSPRLVSCRRTG